MNLETIFSQFNQMSAAITFSLLFLLIVSLLVNSIKGRAFSKKSDEFTLLKKQLETELLEQNQANQQLQQQDHDKDISLAELHTELQHLRELKEELVTCQQLLQREQQRCALLQQKDIALQERISYLEKSEERVNNQFELLANRIFSEKGLELQQQSKQSIESVLQPLKQQLDGFKQQVQQSYENEAKQRHSLKDQIVTLQSLNQQISEDAVRLTKALKGDNKQQGDWGELILEQILQSSGLRAGHEYQTQVVGVNQHGQTIKPDVVVKLPDNKSVIVDSKVNLVAYERYYNSEDSEAQLAALKEHAKSLRQQIIGLSKKDYHTLYQLPSLDYVLLFIPIEGAYLSALEQDPSLINFALESNILLVSPSSLMVALRTIQNLWKTEHQQQNAQVIAQRAGKLFDKFVAFTEDLKSHGQQLQRSNDSYQNAMNKLSTGKGNLVRQAQQLKDLQINASKSLDAKLLTDSQYEE
ncbi:DNA recombination protein RmuC [Agarivorans sp. B2Z047]|uniref:DNA recombination protein RmuC n=1 Tax=Agarivorans sp. B2Z047 TaxID=2652721 RepID=UPI0014071156|nr:DNA recombination protein RmuC [Agarivorans sp. B2Z047]MPW31092.1 DNA recombination protein RmuC [Agarivorans sp. B2Z047]UQN40679.1 DNA recombination protein RmuC [Agarivorans sp. B2Z047]